MKRFVFGCLMVGLALVNPSTGLAQPPGPGGDRPGGDRPGGDRPGGDRPGGDRPGGDRPGGDRPRADRPRGEGPEQGGPRPPLPIVDAIDKNHDHLISADELKTAVAAMLTLDRNGDGQLQEDEYLPRRVDGGGPPGPRDGDRGPEAGRPPRDGDRGPEARGPGDRGPGDRGPEGRGPEGRDQVGLPPPSPERFVDHAMTFDVDKDGKLNRDELMKFAMQMPNHQPGGGPPGDNPPGDRRREGDRPATPERRGDRPARPDQE